MIVSMPKRIREEGVKYWALFVNLYGISPRSASIERVPSGV